MGVWNPGPGATDGNDRYVGDGSDETVNGLGGDDAIAGDAGADTLYGSDGADTLNGGVGRDVLDGGAGNDIFYVDNMYDVVRDSNGTDVVRTTVSFSLSNSESVERLTIIGDGPRNGVGNWLDNVLTGNGARNLLYGGLGNDTLYGGGGDDYLRGDVGDDVLRGGGGNDAYNVDSEGDVVIEVDGEGIDTVTVSLELGYFTLGAFVENAALYNSGGGSGNDLDNVLTSYYGAEAVFGAAGADTITTGAGNDTLDGGVGADLMRGEGDNDTYVIDDAEDVVVELANGGVDTVRSAMTRALDANVENLILTGAAARNGSGNTQGNQINGNSAANALSGRAGADTILGGDGHDKLNGGEGADVLTGGSGMDTFVFDAPRLAANSDVVTDFKVAHDIIHLDNAIFAQLGAEGALDPTMFHIGASPADANDFLFYNAATGALYYDANANAAGGAFRIATLSTGLALTAADFLVI